MFVEKVYMICTVSDFELYEPFCLHLLDQLLRSFTPMVYDLT